MQTISDSTSSSQHLVTVVIGNNEGVANQPDCWQCVVSVNCRSGLLYDIASYNSLSTNNLSTEITSIEPIRVELPKSYPLAVRVNYVKFLLGMEIIPDIGQQLLCDSFKLYHYTHDCNYFDYLIERLRYMWPCYWLFDLHSDLQREIWLHLPYQLLPANYLSDIHFVNDWYCHNLGKPIVINGLDSYHFEITVGNSDDNGEWGGISNHEVEFKLYRTMAGQQVAQTQIVTFRKIQTDTDTDSDEDTVPEDDNEEEEDGEAADNMVAPANAINIEVANAAVPVTVTTVNAMTVSVVDAANSYRLLSTLSYFNKLSHGRHVYYYRSGELKTVIDYYEGKIHGNYVSYFKNGKVDTFCSYYQNQEHGQKLDYYRNGRLKKLVNYNMGYKSGLAVEYYNDARSTITVMGNYEQSRKSSLWLYFHKNGRYDEAIEYKAGDKHGQYHSWYESGNLAINCEYKDDQRDGAYTSYHDQVGLVIRSIGNYFEDEKYGLWLRYDEQSRLLERANWFHDHYHGLCQRYTVTAAMDVADAVETADAVATNADAVEITAAVVTDANKESVLEIECHYVDGRKHGPYTQYKPESGVYIVGEMSNDSRHGLWITYSSADHSIIRVSNYDDGTRLVTTAF